MTEHPPLTGVVDEERSGGHVGYVNSLAETILGPDLLLEPDTRLGFTMSITPQRGGRPLKPRGGRVNEPNYGGRFP